MTFAERLRQLRDARGLTEAELAAACGVGAAALHDYESGRRTPSMPHVVKIARALGVDRTAFAGCEDRPGGPGIVRPTAPAPIRTGRKMAAHPRKRPAKGS